MAIRWIYSCWYLFKTGKSGNRRFNLSIGLSRRSRQYVRGAIRLVSIRYITYGCLRLLKTYRCPGWPEHGSKVVLSSCVETNKDHLNTLSCWGSLSNPAFLCQAKAFSPRLFLGVKVMHRAWRLLHRSWWCATHS